MNGGSGGHPTFTGNELAVACGCGFAGDRQAGDGDEAEQEQDGFHGSHGGRLIAVEFGARV